MSTPRGPHSANVMFQGYYREPFGDGGMSCFATVQPIPAAFDAEKRLDYDVRTDENPIYIAFAEYKFTDDTTTLTPTTDTDTWIIQKLTYDASSRITRIQVARGTWDNRATLF